MWRLELPGWHLEPRETWITAEFGSTRGRICFPYSYFSSVFVQKINSNKNQAADTEQTRAWGEHWEKSTLFGMLKSILWVRFLGKKVCVPKFTWQLFPKQTSLFPEPKAWLRECEIPALLFYCIPTHTGGCNKSQTHKKTPILMENLEIGSFPKGFTGSGEDGVKLAVSSSLMNSLKFS